MKQTYSLAADFGPNYDFAFLSLELKASVLPFDYASSDGVVVDVFFTVALDAAQIVVLDALVAAHDLSAAKHSRASDVDKKTGALVAAGFVHGGEQFSLSMEAQLNWGGVITMGAAAGLTYPYPVATLTNSYYLATDEPEMQVMAGVALNRKGWCVGSGSALKKQINDAADQTALDAIVDTR